MVTIGETQGIPGVHFLLNVFEGADSEKALHEVRKVLQQPDSPISGLQNDDFESAPAFRAVIVRLPGPIKQELWRQILAKIGSIASVDASKTSPPALTDYKRELPKEGGANEGC